MSSPKDIFRVECRKPNKAEWHNYMEFETEYEADNAFDEFIKSELYREWRIVQVCHFITKTSKKLEPNTIVSQKVD